jgi:DNA-binding beta-propeller fold protein YncE
LSVIFDGKNIWIANGTDSDDGAFVTGSVTKLRAYGGINLGTFPVGSHVRGLAYDGSAIWTCNSIDNTITLLNATNGARLGTYRTGRRPRALAFDGARMWIANAGDNTVSVVATSAKPVVSSQFAPGGRTNYAPIRPVPLAPIQTEVDAAFSGLSVDPRVTPAAVSAIVGTLLSDN